MEYRRLGRTDVTVSAICLGTMTWGRQNTEAEGHAQMNYAFDQGVTFFDTAEMYAVPPTADTYGKTEEIIGTWFQATGRRTQVFLASKVSGPGPMPWVRGGQHRLDRANIHAAVDASLRRLRTDYIDLYQVHWPQRPLALFGRGTPEGLYSDGGVPIEVTLAALDELVTAGKVRHIGVSNETAWGVMAYLRAAERQGLPRIASIQNVYNLLSRVFDTDLAEVAVREQVGLLGYSPLAGGTLSGKYLNGAMPAGSRRAIDTRGSRYGGPVVDPIVERYLDIARRHGLNPTQMAISFALRQPFMTAVIIGATNMANLESNIAAADVTLSDAVVDEIEAVHQSNPSPCP
ncbi:aldo/keto reductase [Nitrospirillum viridazoti Y2]|uniref:Aryl-alcohol dehydrogenase-like predicted oxidoreductase n=1 Tax=Nitrospirillum amazonense TaxID=28077 RepID=A0A560I6F0_9PROT|nr:aldo/keto reductase [Nitrospirillum amazonense]EGX99568.1 aldo/keto reductase [Nitrospirillum amazonense Y2]TWB54553.1 aryl-alcohol dehydrogenase-like predicted oxidoreductase [Nitrospirillum amazonense]